MSVRSNICQKTALKKVKPYSRHCSMTCQDCSSMVVALLLVVAMLLLAVDAVVGSGSDQVVKPGDTEADVLKVLPPPSRIDRVAVRDGVVELWYFDKAGILIRMKKIGPHPGEVLSSSDLR